MREARTAGGKRPGSARRPPSRSRCVYKSKGALASLGARRGVAEVSASGCRLAGVAAVARLLPVVRAGLRHEGAVPAQWLLEFDGGGRSTVQTGSVRQGHGARYIRYRAGDRVFEEGNRADGLYAVVEGGAFESRSAAGRAARPSADRAPAAISASGAARRGASHRHGARARGFGGAGCRRRGLPAADVGVAAAQELLRRLYRGDVPGGPEVSRRRFLARGPDGFAANPCITFANGATLCLLTLRRAGSGGGDGHAMTGAAEFRAVFPT